jgi:hypothetical protein
MATMRSDHRPSWRFSSLPSLSRSFLADHPPPGSQVCRTHCGQRDKCPTREPASYGHAPPRCHRRVPLWYNAGSALPLQRLGPSFQVSSRENLCWCRRVGMWAHTARSLSLRAQWEQQGPAGGMYKGTRGGEAISFSACDDSQVSADTKALSRVTSTGVSDSVVAVCFFGATS